MCVCVFLSFRYVTLFRHECHVSGFFFFIFLSCHNENNEVLRSQVAHKTASKDNSIDSATVCHTIISTQTHTNRNWSKWIWKKKKTRSLLPLSHTTVAAVAHITFHKIVCDKFIITHNTTWDTYSKFSLWTIDHFCFCFCTHLLHSHTTFIHSNIGYYTASPFFSLSHTLLLFIFSF